MPTLSSTPFPIDPQDQAGARQQMANEQGLGLEQLTGEPRTPFYGGQEVLGMPSGLWQQSGSSPYFFGEQPEQTPYDVTHFDDHLDTMQVPTPPWYADKSHPQHDTKGAMLLRVLQAAAVGGLAGAGQRTVGGGFFAGQQAFANIQQMRAARQAAADIHQQRQVEITGARQRMADAADNAESLRKYRDALIDKAKQRPADKLLHSYTSADGSETLIFQTPDGDTYEKPLGKVYQKPEAGRRRQFIIMGRFTYEASPDGKTLTRVGPAPEHQGTDKQGRPRSHDATMMKIEQWKQNELRKIENHSMLDDETRLNMKQTVQNAYEQMIEGATGQPVSHFDYRTQQGTGAPVGVGVDPKNPAGLRR